MDVAGTGGADFQVTKVVHEIWSHDGGCYMFKRGAKGWRETLNPNARLLHTFEAEGVHEAFLTYYRLMGLGEWNSAGVPDDRYTEADNSN